jgi:vitamin B12 transporter
MRRILLIVALGAATISAAETDSAELTPVVVTASRAPQATDDVVLPIIIITGEEIRLRQVTDLGELLASVPGIDIGRNGGPGQAVSLFVRGTESNHVLVLVDGLRINPGTIGGANLHHIDPDQVERIEILRGPRAALYGDQALGGVINIITRTGRSGQTVDLGTRVGSFGTFGADLGFEHASDDWAFDLSLGHERTDGYAFRRGSTETPDYDDTSVMLGLQHRGDGATTSLRLWSARADSEYLDFFLSPASQTSVNRSVQVERSERFGENWSSTVRLSQVVDQIDQDLSADFVRSQRLGIDWLNRFTLDGGLIAGLGVNLEHENADALSFGTGFDEDTDDRSIYGDLTGGAGPNDWMVALRYSDYESFGGEFTWNAEIARDLSDETRMYAAAGTAFRAPDAFDRFGFGGDPGLDVERSSSVDIGLHHSFGGGHEIDLSLYRTDIRDLIEFDFGTSMLMNTEHARIEGLEVSYAWASTAWSVQSSVVLQRPRNQTTGQDLARRSSESLNLAVTRQLLDWTLRADLRAVGDRLDSPFAPTRIGGYVLVDLSTSWRIRDGLTLRVKAENLLDADYQTADGYSGRGRGLFVSLDFQRKRQ